MSRETFLQPGGILHGGDYNPEQWLNYPDILKEDIEMMKKAHVNTVTMGIFSWSVYEPVEGELHFDWLEKIMDKLYENGIYTILATPSAAKPAWLDETYPEALRVTKDGVRRHHGGRHNHCMTSPQYRKCLTKVTRALAERFADHPGLLMWHVSNEYGGECYCPLCAQKFQEYLQKKFDNDIEKLNHAWWTTFWSHRYNDFSQIEPPFVHGERNLMGLNLEWKRFTTYNTTDFMRQEIEILRQITPKIAVTTNFVTLSEDLDYQAMAPFVDIISWDSYPSFHNDSESLYDTMLRNSFHHTVMRSMKKERPFLVMESTPSLVNWQRFNKLKRPGIHSLSSLQAIACGSDSVLYFQWRKSRGGSEQYHGAVVDHLGSTDTRVFKEVEKLGEELKKLREVRGSLVKAKAALVFDWDNRWALSDVQGMSKETLNYEKTCMDWWCECTKLGVETDIISVQENFEDYKVILIPMLYMLKDGVAKRLHQFVEKGGILIGSYITGYVDENQLCFMGGFPGDGLGRVFGVYSEELDTLYPLDENSLWEDGKAWLIKDYAERLRLCGAKVKAVYGSDFYQGEAAVTQNTLGKGCAYYVGARVELSYMKQLFQQIFNESGMQLPVLPGGVECHVRKNETDTYTFYLNHTKDSSQILDVYGWELLQNKKVEGTILLPPYGVVCIRQKRRDKDGK